MRASNAFGLWVQGKEIGLGFLPEENPLHPFIFLRFSLDTQGLHAYIAPKPSCVYACVWQEKDSDLEMFANIRSKPNPWQNRGFGICRNRASTLAKG